PRDVVGRVMRREQVELAGTRAVDGSDAVAGGLDGDSLDEEAGPLRRVEADADGAGGHLALDAERTAIRVRELRRARVPVAAAGVEEDGRVERTPAGSREHVAERVVRARPHS